MRGRKPTYTTERVTAICRAIADGESYKIACSRAGISEATFARWREKYEDFEKAIKRAEQEYNDWYTNDLVRDCKKSLKMLITGTEITETTTEYVSDKDGNPTIKHQRVVTKMIMPNATAIIFALTNRDPDNWKNRQTTDVNANVKSDNETKVDLSAIPEDLLEQVLNKINGNE